MPNQTGLFATARLVGRDEQLKEILEIVQNPSPLPRGIFLIDEGGIGKTKLLEETLKRLSDDKDDKVKDKFFVANDIVDFYHMSPHIRYGLADALYTALPRMLKRFEMLREQVEQYRVTGDFTGFARARDAAVAEFIEYLRYLTSERPVVVALDTAERLLYGAGQMPPPLDDVADSWRWFLELLNGKFGELKNFIFLLAGRPAAKRLADDLRNVLQDRLFTPELGKLQEDHAIDYFDALAEAAQQNGAPEVASRVRLIETEQRQVVHFLSDGRPIFLSLLADLAALESPQPPILKRPLAEIKALSDDEFKQAHQTLKEQLVTRLVTQKPLGDTIIYLGCVPKGADAELLADLFGEELEQAMVRLDRFKELSIARRRQAEKREDRPMRDRYFLHDEMYVLLDEFYFQSDAGQVWMKKAAKDTQRYYTTQLNICRDRINQIYAPIETQDISLSERDREILSLLNARRRTLLTEDVYYRLKREPRNGFRWYYRYSREATLSRETEIDFRLEAVMLEYWTEQITRHNGTKAELTVAENGKNGNGLERGQVLGIVAMRPTVRAWAENKYGTDEGEALWEAARLRREGQEILDLGAPNSEAILSVWEAYCLVTSNEVGQVPREKLDHALDTLRPTLSADIADDLADFKSWRTKAIVAFAYRVRGYLHSKRGELRSAVADYTEAARLWRDLTIEVEEAETLNDLGYVLALLGQFGDARALVADARNLRRELGPRYPVALSINTLANIDLFEGLYEGALKKADQSLKLFRAMKSDRGIGLAFLVLAEAKRRHSQTDEVPNPEDKVALLREARDYAQTAHKIFSEQVKELAHEISALIELGCIFRAWVKIRRKSPSPRDPWEDHFAESVVLLRQAADRAANEFRHRRADALVNLAWLGFFVNDEKLMEEAAQDAKTAIPPEYYINPATGKPDIGDEQAQAVLWSQIGKLYVLDGHRAFSFWEREHEKPDDQRNTAIIRKALELAAEYYTLGLAHDELLSHDYRDLRRAQDEIYNNFKRLNARELTIVAKIVKQTEGTNNLLHDKPAGTLSAMHELLRDRTIWFGAEES